LIKKDFHIKGFQANQLITMGNVWVKWTVNLGEKKTFRWEHKSDEPKRVG